MNRFLLTTAVILLAFSTDVMAQTEEELKTQKSEKEAAVKDLEGQIATIKGEISGIDAQLIKFPRWKKGAFGVIGLDFNNFSDWLGRDKANTSSASIGISANAFANYFTEKSFWRNSLNTNFGWVKFDDKDDETDNDDYQETADVINLMSLYGYKLSNKVAISTMGEYRSTLLSNFNNPGYLDLGAGITWTPIANLVVVIHPLNYNFVFSNMDFEYQSSLGSKIMADYSNEIAKGINWRSNLSAFLSYEDGDLSNWTWVNGLSFKVAGGLGVGFELGLRNNKQEALAKEFTDNPLQTYWTLGLTYSL